MPALKSIARLLQVFLTTTAVVLFLTWLFLFAWELLYHQILLDGYLSGFFAWVVILLLMRKLIGSLI